MAPRPPPNSASRVAVWLDVTRSASPSTARWHPTRRVSSIAGWSTPVAGRGPVARRRDKLTNAIVTALGFPRGDRIVATNDLAAARSPQPGPAMPRRSTP